MTTPTETTPRPDRYRALIAQIVTLTLKGQIRSKEQVYQMLNEGVAIGTGELFERCLEAEVSQTQQLAEMETDELKQAKATRQLRALKTIQGEWERWQAQNRVQAVLISAMASIQSAPGDDRPRTLLQVIDPNEAQPLTTEQVRQLAKQLQTVPEGEVQALGTAIAQGLADWETLEPHLVSWLYEQSRNPLGFGGVSEQRGPWALWAKHTQQPLLRSLLTTLANDRPLADFLAAAADLTAADWLALTITLQWLQRGLVRWFDRQPYDPKLGKQFSIATFLTFAVLWGQLANTVEQAAIVSAELQQTLANSCFQVMLQTLRAFAQQPYFPLYGGIFALFSTARLRDTLDYLDVPLRQAAGTQEKARILTLLGDSQRVLGNTEVALAFHEEALKIARSADDRACEIANLNHLSRTYAAQSDYGAAIDQSQRALLLARQVGDRPGEANALANLGYSQVLAAQQENADPETYETAVRYLEQGVQLAARQGDMPSLALCHHSLGIAYLVLQKPEAAIAQLEQGLQTARYAGDLHLQALNFAYLAEAHYSLQQLEQAIALGCLGLYLLEQMAAVTWRRVAGLLTIIQGQVGVEAFWQQVAQVRSAIVPVIGVDGYDYLPQVLTEYQRSL
ncbi:tetratricopeptide repeat protein [Trichothermofontia sp.]